MTDTGNVYSELHPGVEHTITTDIPESIEDEVQVDTMENLAAEMDPPPPELDEMEQVIEAQGEHWWIFAVLNVFVLLAFVQ